MKNEMLPAYGGNMKVSMSEVPARSDTTVMLNLYGNMNFSCIDHSNLQQHNKDQYYGFAIPPADHQSGLSSIMTAKRLDYHHDAAAAAVAGYRPEPKYCNYGDDDHHHDSVLTQSVLPFPKKRFVLHFNDINKAIRNPRKRPPHAEVTHDHKEDSMVMVTGSNKVVDHSNQWKTQKKMPAVRRSQKLGDKITALQKLVSPYGKTDTASVLEEAYISIKFLQDQIQNLIWKLSSSSTDVLDIGSHKHQKTEERQHALRIRGMCLVPVPFHTKDSRTLQEQLINQRLVSEELCIRSQTIKSHTA